LGLTFYGADIIPVNKSVRVAKLRCEFRGSGERA
jgi:hypothetical protein